MFWPCLVGLCVQLNSLWFDPVFEISLGSFFHPVLGILSPCLIYYIEHPSFVDFPGAARKLVVPGLKVLGGDNERRSCVKILFSLSLFSFVFLCSSLRSRAVTVFLRVEGAIPSLFVH